MVNRRRRTAANNQQSIPPVATGRPVGRRRILLGTALLLTAAVVAILAVWFRAATAPPPYNILLISIDTLRADHLGVYGYDRPTSPHIDALARQGVTFTQAICQNTNTNPSHASMLSGLYPRAHGNWDNFYLMADDVPLLAEVLREAGHATAAFLSGYTLKERICALDRGFDVYDDSFSGKERRGDHTTDLALDWLGNHARQRFFLFVHLFDPHGPYDPPAAESTPFVPRTPPMDMPVARIPNYQRLPLGAVEEEVWTDLRRYEARYDDEIVFADRQVGRLLQALEEHGVAGDTVVLLTSDHGEAIGERFHLLDHGGGVGDEEIHVPLILRLPGDAHAGGRFVGQVQSIDIAPTLAATVGLQFPAPVQGRDLVALLEESAAGDAHQFALTETRVIPYRWRHRPYELRRDESLKALRGEAGKLVIFPGTQRNYLEFYDLAADPAESVDLYPARPQQAQHHIDAVNLLLQMPARHNQTADPENDPETREIFRTLGYVE